MTTAQESTNGHHSLPPPCSFPDSQDQNPSKDSTNINSNSVSATMQAAASAYHVPPELYAPKADSFRDTIPDGLSTMKMPDRCQFMFSDGRQCTMARSDIHPSLCTYHADREEQLFGDPSHGFVTRKLDFPELFSASRDLTTAVGVNRALAQVFRLLAQRRISRQEAATFAKLAHLLLQSIRAASQEQPITEIVEREKPFAANLYQHDDLRGVKEVITPLLPHKQVDRGAQTMSVAANSPVPPLASSSSPEPLPVRTVVNNSSGMNTSATVACNSPEINTYKNVKLKSLQNEHLRKNGSRSLCSSGRPHAFGRET